MRGVRMFIILQTFSATTAQNVEHKMSNSKNILKDACISFIRMHIHAFHALCTTGAISSAGRKIYTSAHTYYKGLRVDAKY